MGMYTEIIFGARLKSDLPPEVVRAIEILVKGGRDNWISMPDHEFFQSERAAWLFNMASCYFPEGGPPSFHKDGIHGDYYLNFRSSLKNYDGEIPKFLDWIKPYIEEGSGGRDMYAITCYEEDDEPTMHFLREGET